MNYMNFFNEDLPAAIGIFGAILVSGAFGLNQFALLFVIVLLVLIWFYRAPEIDIPQYMLQSNELYSPAYGTIESIKHIDGQYHVEVKLELWDVHIQYFPTSGEVYDQIYKPYSVTTKMKNLMWGANPKDREIYITQRIGYVARRIATPEVRGPVLSGKRLGMIKLGSHVDLVISDKYKLLIKPDDPVRGPYTRIAVWDG
jgi:phosphatidylserine decarboxylase precursor-related protein